MHGLGSALLLLPLAQSLRLGHLLLRLLLLQLLLPLRWQVLLGLLCLCRYQGGIRACSAAAQLRASS